MIPNDRGWGWNRAPSSAAADSGCLNYRPGRRTADYEIPRLNIVFFHQVAEAAIAELQHFGGAGLHAVGLAQGRLDEGALHAGDIALQVNPFVRKMLRRRWKQV